MKLFKDINAVNVNEVGIFYPENKEFSAAY